MRPKVSSITLVDFTGLIVSVRRLTVETGGLKKVTCLEIVNGNTVHLLPLDETLVNYLVQNLPTALGKANEPDGPSIVNAIAEASRDIH